MDISTLINAIISREGGYVNNPDDRGGPTNFGITQAVARSQGYLGPMRDLPPSEAVDIYTRRYWLKPQLNLIGDIAPQTSAKLLDIAVNMGPATAIGFLKRALNALNRNGTDYADLPLAPVVDAPLLAALTAFITKRGSEGEVVLLKAINALQGAQYIAIAEHRPADKAFVYGWLNNRIG